MEVAETSLDYDRDTKAALYAAAGILEFWLAAILSQTVTAYRDPVGGAYRSVTAYQRGDHLAPLAFPRSSLSR
ncbi:MAG: Uma2 family endonuclease [Dehalococcoidia bacterium]